MKKKKIEKYKDKPNLINGNKLVQCDSLKCDINDLMGSISSLSHNLLCAGYYLNKVRSHEMFNNMKYESIYEFMEKNCNISKITTKNLISIYSKFGHPKHRGFDDKYLEYDFSQLVDLINIKDSIDNYLPYLGEYDVRLSKFYSNIILDNMAILYWFENDLFNYLKTEYKNCDIKYLDSIYQISICYKKCCLSLSISNEDIGVNCYCSGLNFKISCYVDFSCTSVSEKVNEFIEKVNSRGD